MTKVRYHTTAEYVQSVGRMIRAAGRRVGQADPDDLALLVNLHAALDDAIQAAVDGQRAAGIRWRSIGEATGTTPQAAVQKWYNRPQEVETAG
jgi:hypothetical protein